MSKLLTLSITVSEDVNLSDYIPALMTGMQDFAGRPCVEKLSVSCHTLDEDDKIKDTVFVMRKFVRL
jgi:hypothetical protein